MSTPIDNGGPAFPFGQVSEATGQPINGFFAPGMTLRDWFAGQALAGLMASAPMPEHPAYWDWLSGVAVTPFRIADAMIEARKGGRA